MTHASRFLLAAAVLALGLTYGVEVRGQGADAALRDRVAQLVDRLDDAKADVREKSQESLIELGPRILPLLPELATIKSAEQKDRLAKVREALQEAQDEVNLGPSIVTIQGEGIRLSEVVKELQKQSGNVITDLREVFGGDATNPALDLDIQEKPFLEALDIVCKKAQITPSFYTGDGTIGLMPGGPDLPVEIGSSLPQLKSNIVYVGPFRIVLKQLGAIRNFVDGGSSANAQFEVAWEPRIRPMLLSIKSDELKIVDDRGEEVAPSVMQEENTVPLRPENPVAELNLNMDTPNRQAQKLAKIQVKAEVTVPASVRAFRFPDLTKSGTQEIGDITMTLVSTEVDEHVWKVRVRLKYPGEGAAFETYRQGLFNNRLWLQKADGSRFEHNGGFSNTAYDVGMLGFEYLFVDAPGKPGDYGLVYETPSKVEPIPLEFEFDDVPLP